jgi:anti-sigma B factor antagonist
MILTIEVTPTECCTILKLTGRITLGEGSVILRDKAKSLIQAGHTRLVLDASEITYVDSSGFGTLYTNIWPWTHNAGGEFVIVNPQKKVFELLQITKLLTVQPIFATTEEAIAYFREKMQKRTQEQKST